jgi:hypothetical protein
MGVKVMCKYYVHKGTGTQQLQERYRPLFYKPQHIFFLNVLVQIANKMGIQKCSVSKRTLQIWYRLQIKWEYKNVVFQKELYKFESLYEFIQRTCTVF